MLIPPRGATAIGIMAPWRPPFCGADSRKSHRMKQGLRFKRSKNGNTIDSKKARLRVSVVPRTHFAFGTDLNISDSFMVLDCFHFVPAKR